LAVKGHFAKSRILPFKRARFAPQNGTFHLAICGKSECRQNSFYRQYVFKHIAQTYKHLILNDLNIKETR